MFFFIQFSHFIFIFQINTDTFPEREKKHTLTFKIYIYAATGSWMLSCVDMESLRLAEKPSISGCVCTDCICLPDVTLMAYEDNIQHQGEICSFCNYLQQLLLYEQLWNLSVPPTTFSHCSVFFDWPTKHWDFSCHFTTLTTFLSHHWTADKLDSVFSIFQVL